MGFEFETGAIIGAAMIAIYCFSGGLRASIWTDAAQSLVMLLALLVIVLSSLYELGGFGGLMMRLESISPTLVQLFPDDKPWLIYFIGSSIMGAGIVGQPHIIIRIMTLKNVEDFRQTKKVYFYYYIPFLVLATMAGLCCRAILSDTSAFDPELAFAFACNNAAS